MTNTTSNVTTAHSILLQLWNDAPKVDFNPEWKNGTGYLDFATHTPELAVAKDTYVALTDDLNRKVILKGLGNDFNLVIFERNPEGKGGIVVTNLPHPRTLRKNDIKFFSLPFNSSLSKETMETVAGTKESNVIFYPEFSSEILKFINKETLVEVGQKLVEDIENSLPITVKHLESVGIDLSLFEVYFNIKQVNV